MSHDCELLKRSLRRAATALVRGLHPQRFAHLSIDRTTRNIVDMQNCIPVPVLIIGGFTLTRHLFHQGQVRLGNGQPTWFI